MDVNVDKKAEETVIKLLDWIQNVTEREFTTSEELAALPEVVKATSQLLGGIRTI